MSLKKKMGLGKGLDALFLDNDTSDQNLNILIDINSIEPNRNQPRKYFDEIELTYLADSIKQYGLIQPILVRPYTADGIYQIVAGERRWRACRMIGLTEVPCIIKELKDVEVLEIALIENLQRENLNVIEEALGYRELIENFNLTQEQVAQKIGKSRPVIANALRLLNLPERVITLIKNGDITSGHARILLSIGDENKIIELADLVVSKNLTVRDLEIILKGLKSANSNFKSSIKPNRDTFYKEVELSLAEQLGRKIKISTKNDKCTLEIEFYNKQELSDIANRLADINK